MFAHVAEVELTIKKDTGNHSGGFVRFRFLDTRDTELLQDEQDVWSIQKYVKRKVRERLAKRGYERLIPRFWDGKYDFDIKFQVFQVIQH